MRRIVLATGNPGKVRELNAALSGLDVEVIAQSELGVIAAAETGLTFVENAILKARNACRHTGLASIADDSGLEVQALGGAPGIRSARYAGGAASDRENIERLLEAMFELPDDQRAARFHCVLVLLRHADDPTPLICQGTWRGQVLRAPRGAGGFGYDPVFLLPDRQLTAAEITLEEKNRESHRGQAIARLAHALRDMDWLPASAHERPERG